MHMQCVHGGTVPPVAPRQGWWMWSLQNNTGTPGPGAWTCLLLTGVQRREMRG